MHGGWSWRPASDLPAPANYGADRGPWLGSGGGRAGQQRRALSGDARVGAHNEGAGVMVMGVDDGGCAGEDRGGTKLAVCRNDEETKERSYPANATLTHNGYPERSL